MKTILLLAVLSAGVSAPVFAFEASPIPRTGETFASEAELMQFLSRARIGVGTERGTVLDQFGEPQVLLHRDLWVFTNFRAANVYGGESLDTLVVVFANNRVARITLTTARVVQALVARQRSSSAGRTDAE